MIDSLITTINHLDSTKHTFNNFGTIHSSNESYWIESINIILNFLIAFGAIYAIIVSNKTLKQTKQFKIEEDEKRRALIVPADEPGHVYSNLQKKFDYPFQITLYNAGVNPAHNIKFKLVGFQSLQNKLTVQHNQSWEMVNPVPLNGKIFITNPMEQNEDLIVDKAMLSSLDYFVIKITYNDIVLKKEFVDQFYWKTNFDGILFEISFDQKNNLDTALAENKI